jgi:hypothetical protein
MSNSNRLGYECKFADLPKYTIVRTRTGTYIHMGHGNVRQLKSNLGPVDGHTHTTDLWAPHNWMIVTPDEAAAPSKGRHAATVEVVSPKRLVVTFDQDNRPHREYR